MNIRIIKYFITIIENDLNITKAAQKLYISQPALSKAINKFENDNSIIIFERASGRLQKLTPAGVTLYIEGKKLLANYEKMKEALINEAYEIKGNINIGISPVIISYLFPTVLPKFIKENPQINLSIIEEGAVNLQSKLISDQIHMGTLLSPTGLNTDIFQQIKLSQSKLAVFMNKNHNLADNNYITWKDLDKQTLALFSDSYMINQQITDFLEKNGSKPKIQLKSGSWDLLLNSTQQSNLITILPKPIVNFHNMKDIIVIDFEENIKWDIYLCRRKKKVYSNVEEYVFNYFIEYFKFNDFLNESISLK